MADVVIERGINAGMVARVDDADLGLVTRYQWWAIKDHHTYYAYTRVGGRIVSMHQLVFNGDGRMIDHIDHDGLNNQKSNLRFTTNSANQANGRPRMNALGYRGVSRSQGKFRAQIKVDGRAIFLGRFDDPIAAARAYDAAVRRFHGEHATVNFGGDA